MGVVAPTIDMSNLVHKENPCPLIPMAQPIMGWVINPNQDRLDNGGRGLRYDLLPLNLL